jgi:hypothetical protein
MLKASQRLQVRQPGRLSHEVALVGEAEAQGTKARRKSQAPGAGDAPEEILAEVFGARPSDLDEMIRLRLEERSWNEEGQGPERFCTGE